MSIICNEVQQSALLKKAALYGVKDYVRAKIDPSAASQLPFPSDYAFSDCFLSKKYETLADRVHEFRVRPDDVYTVSFPKSGTTWILNIVWQLRHNIDLSAELLTAADLYLERPIFYDFTEENRHDDNFRRVVVDMEGYLERFDNDASPRVFKSHLLPHLLPKAIWTVKPKIVYIYRDPKDAVVSMFHMFRNNSRTRYEGTMNDFLDAFLNGYVMYGPYHDHVNSFQQLKHLDHILLLKYEDMIANPFNGIKRISDFLECSYSDEQLKQLTEHLSFHSMRSKAIDPITYPNGFRYSIN